MCMICVYVQQTKIYIDIKYVELKHGNKYFMVVNRTAGRMQGPSSVFIYVLGIYMCVGVYKVPLE